MAPTLPPAAAKFELDRDLDLDLPDDLTAALGQNLHLQSSPRSRGLSENMLELKPPARVQPRSASYGSLGRQPSPKGTSKEPGKDSPPPASPHRRGSRRRPSLGSIFASPGSLAQSNHKEQATQDTQDPVQPVIALHQYTDAELPEENQDVDEDGVGLTDSESSLSMDQEWVGNLGRDELESMLMDAKRIIKERERELGIAAAIGKALLEKNISLRSKHTGLANRLASSTSIFNMAEMEGIISNISSTDSTFAPLANQPCSPPTTDIDITSQPGHSRTNSNDAEDQDATPLASTASDYFTGVNTSSPYRATAQGTRQPLAPVVPTQSAQDGSPIVSRVGTRSDAQEHKYEAQPQQFASPVRPNWVPSVAGLISSQPASPSESIASSWSRAAGMRASPSMQFNAGSHDSSRRGTTRRHARNRPSMTFTQAAETQRQLAALSEQNEALLQQLGELQAEAEAARLEGSKKLKKLNREIGGLKSELESATKRNVELENGSVAEEVDSASNKPRKRWTRGGGVGPGSPWTSGADKMASNAVLSPPKARKVGAHNSATEEPTHTHALNVDPVLNEQQEPMPSSSSSLEAMLGYKPGNTEGERALVAQLLSKIKELEETI